MQIVSVEHTVVTLNGTPIQGWANEADAIMMPDIEAATATVGPDGLKCFCTTGEKGGAVSFKLQPNSAGAQFLGVQAARLQARRVVIFNGVIRNHSTGYVSTLSDGALITYPSGISFGTEVNPLIYVINFERIVTLWDGIRTQPIPVAA